MWVYTKTAEGRMLIELESGAIVRVLGAGENSFALLRVHGQERFTLAHFSTEEQAYAALEHLAAKAEAADMDRRGRRFLPY